MAKKALIPAFIVAVVGLATFMAQHSGTPTPVIAAGSVKLQSQLLDKAKGIRTLFVTVFDADSNMPMPYGAIRYRLSGDPTEDVLTFTLTRDNLRVMNPAAAVPTTLRIKARLDRNGQAGPDLPGDLVGEIPSVAVGTRGVQIPIDRYL